MGPLGKHEFCTERPLYQAFEVKSPKICDASSEAGLMWALVVGTSLK